ncbi:Ribonucleoside-diphosphate reductase subunit alpha, partial [Aduncisulcus paluster]
MGIMIQKRNGRQEVLDITKIQKHTISATENLPGVSQSELEIDAQIKFIDGMSSSDIQDALVKTAVEKIDIDVPNWTFVAARLFLFDLYHKVGKATHGIKGNAYCHLAEYIKYGQEADRIIPGLESGYDLDDLSQYLDPTRDYLFNYLAMFLAQNETDKQAKAKEFYDVISKFEVMLATPTLSNARTNRHQLSSCYIGSSPDNIEGIFDGYKEMALLSKFGGGIGWDWNSIRSLGGVIDGHKSAAGGTVPFLKITNDIALAVDQLGTRKGAIAVYLEPWHMDIEDFIDLKKNSGEERRRAHDLFPALWINDLFMKRILADEHWTLFDP